MKIINLITKVVESHILGLLGILAFIFYILFNLLISSLSLDYSERFFFVFNSLILLISLSLCLADFLPERIKLLLYDLIPSTHNIDKRISKYGILVLCLVILIGFFLRINNLSKPAFWADELFTSFAAIGIFKYGSPILPSGLLYERSILNTNLIALSFKIFGINEFSARIVGVIFGILTIPLIYLMGSKVANKRVALLASIIITFSAWEILWSRQARMYAQFQFFYLLTSYLFYLAIDKKDIKFLLLSLFAFIFSYFSHEQAIIFLLVAYVYIIYINIQILKNKYFIFGNAVVIGAVIAYFILAKSTLDFIPLHVPIWGQKPFYFYLFSPELIILILMTFVIIAISIIFWKLGILHDRCANSYLLLNFLIPLLILSVYPWKDERYALFIYPFLVLIASITFDLYIFRNVIDVGTVSGISDFFKLNIEFVKKLKFAIVFIIVMLFFLQIVLSMESFQISNKDNGNVIDVIYSNWKKGSEYVKEKQFENDKIITTLPVATMFYLGKADFYLRQHEYDEMKNTEGESIDIYTGAVILNTYDSFLQRVNNDSGWIIADYRINIYYTDQKVRDYIRNNMTFHPEGSDETIEVYSWNYSKY